MAELLRRGVIAALAPEGVPNMDIVVTSVDGAVQSAVQVKTRRDKGADGGWHMSRKHETIVAPRLFYCFVDLGRDDDARPAVWVMPSAKVAEVVRAAHVAWLSTPGARGQKRNDTAMRRIVPDYTYAYKPAPPAYPLGWMNPYRDAWHLLGPES